ASGCGALVDLSQIPIASAATTLAEQERRNGLSTARGALDHALGDGEDFELILAVPSDDAERLLSDQPLGVPVTDIGRIVTARGVTAKHADGTIKPLPRTGWLY